MLEYPGDCPRCGSEMHVRTARRGPNAGNRFWGCTGYPDCRFTLNIVEDNDPEYNYTPDQMWDEIQALRAENAQMRIKLSSNRPQSNPNVKKLLTNLIKELHQDRWAQFGPDAEEQAKRMSQMILGEREKL